METMSPVERVLRTMDGKPVDRIPVFVPMLENRAACEVLGKPLVSGKTLMNLPGAKLFLDKFGEALNDSLFLPNLQKVTHKRNMAMVEMGFDAAWIWACNEYVCLDHSHMALRSGSIFKAMDDGHGEMGYMYHKPGITTPDEFDAWPYWPNSADASLLSSKASTICVVAVSSETAAGGITGSDVRKAALKLPNWRAPGRGRLPSIHRTKCWCRHR